MSTDMIISALSDPHQRGSFDCGIASLNEYLQRYAGQDRKRNVSRVFVASSASHPHTTLGYYSLSAGSVSAESLPAEYTRRLPRYPVPVAILGRLAVSLSCQKQGIGSLLLVDALKRVYHASQTLAVFAVVVDAIDKPALTYYQQFGFIPLPHHPQRLFLPLDTIANLLDENP